MQSRRKCVCSRTVRLQKKRVKKQKKALNPQNGKSDDKVAVANVKAVPQLGCVSQDIEPPSSVNNLRESQKVLGAIRRVRFTVSTLRQASIREKKGPSLGQIQVKIVISEVPTLLNLRTDVKKRLRDNSDPPAARHGILSNLFTSSEKRTKIRSDAAASTIKPEEREFVVDSGASLHMVSQRDLNSAELETMRISKNPTTVMTANGQVLTREEATVYVKQLDLFETVMLLEETSAVLSLGKLCVDHGYAYHWTTVKNHISPKMAKESIAIYQTTYHSLSTVCRRVPLLHLHLFLQHLHRRILWSARKIRQQEEVKL